MAKFRKRPVVIEAEQWWPGKHVDGIEYGEDSEYGDPAVFIRTLEGLMEVSPGDYIITGVKGEKYPVKEHIFLETYEPVAEDADE